MTGIVRKLLPTGRYRVTFFEGADEEIPKKRRKNVMYTAEQLRKLVAQGTCIVGVTEDDIVCYEDIEDFVESIAVENALFDLANVVKLRWDDVYNCFEIVLYCDNLLYALSDSLKADGISDITYALPCYGDKLWAVGNAETGLRNLIRDAGLYGVVNLKIPNSVDIITKSSFGHADWLKSVEIGDSVTELTENLFRSCYYLQHVKLPSHLTTISEGCFSNCIGLSEVEFPQSLTWIRDSAFQGSGLKRLDLQNFTGIIRDDVFRECKELKSVHITSENGVDLNDSCFYECTALISVTIEGKVEFRQKHHFYGCSSLQSVVLPDGTQLSEDCFGKCTSLKHFEIPRGTTKIPSFCFTRCSALEELSLPDGLTKIDFGAVYGCTALKKLNIPASVESVETMFDGSFDVKALPDLVITASSASPAVSTLRKLLKKGLYKDLVLVD